MRQRGPWGAHARIGATRRPGSLIIIASAADKIGKLATGAPKYETIFEGLASIQAYSRGMSFAVPLSVPHQTRNAMKRREFMQRTTAAAAGTLIAAHAAPARAQAHRETLLTVSENGPNTLDIMGLGINRPGYEASWNTFDRLVTHGTKKDADGHDRYDFNSIVPELAEFLEPRRHVGHLQTAQGR